MVPSRHRYLATVSIRQRVEATATRGGMALPGRVQRALAGRPVVIDGQTLAPELQLMLRMNGLVMPAIPSVPVAKGRTVLRRQTDAAGGAQPIGSVRDLGAGGRPARLYAPANGSTALLVFFHGGAFMYGDLDTHEQTCRFLAERAGVQVLAVDYRLAPEHTFPAAHDDALAAYHWALDHLDDLGVARDRVAVGGDSAGGNLAAAVALAAARDGLPLAFQLLVYPACENADRDTRSSRIFAEGFFLTREFMAMGTETYTPDPADRTDPRISPLRAEIPAGLAPAYVATAGFDPLRDEGEAYGRRLAEAGVAVEVRRFPDQIHGFFNLLLAPRSRAAVEEIAEALRVALAPSVTRFTG